MTTPPLDMHTDQLASSVFLAGGALYLLVSPIWTPRRSLGGRTAMFASLDSSALIRWAAATVTTALCVVGVIGLRSLTRSTEQPAGSPARELEPTT